MQAVKYWLLYLWQKYKIVSKDVQFYIAVEYLYPEIRKNGTNFSLDCFDKKSKILLYNRQRLYIQPNRAVFLCPKINETKRRKT